MTCQLIPVDSLCKRKHSHPHGPFNLRPSTQGGCRGLGRLYSRSVLLGLSGKRLQCHRYKRVRTMAQAVGLGSALPLTEGWGLWTLIAISASFAQVLQTQTQVGKLLSAPLLAILLGLALSAGGIIPLDCPAYARISGYLLPLAAALYLLESDLKELASTARDTVVAFLAATLGTVIGTVAAWQAVGHLLGPDGWKVAAALCGSYVGGSVNFAAVSAALGLPPGPLLAAAMSADMVAMAGYLAVISSWPVTDKGQTAVGQQGYPAVKEGASADSLSMSLAAAMLACALGTWLAELAGIPGFSLGLVAIFASGFASLGVAVNSSLDGGKTRSPFQGAEALGGALMSYFFVTIGAAAGSVGAILQTGWLTGFIAIQLAVHLAVTVGLGCLLRLPMQAILTASNAAIGGPATAASMAGARQWTREIRPALIVGALGYSIGTGIGISVGHFLHPV